MSPISWVTIAWAQIDPSSALLLNSGRGTNSGIDSGRYKIRPKAESSKKDDQHGVPAKKQKEEENNEPVTVTVPYGQPVLASDYATSSQVISPQQVIVRCDALAAACANSNGKESGSSGAEPRQDYRDLGRRLNLMDLSFSPGYIYNNSDSGYSYRSYTYSTPTLTVDANVWMHPGFALRGSYTGTLSGHISDSANGSKNIPAMQEWFTAGFRSRKFFGSDAMASALSFGFDYYDYQFRVPSDAALREKLHSTGIRLALDAEIPVSASRSWTVGATLAPKLRHVELSTGIDFQSGGNVDANSVGISFGSRIQFERHDAVFWKVSHTVEKDLFSGDATKADQNGTTPSGVAVINSFSLIEVGYAWGN